MSKLPQLTGRELIVLLQKAGFKVIGQRGAHVSLRKGDRRLIIPYNETLAEKTLLNILDQAHLDAKQILTLLHEKGHIPKEEHIQEAMEQLDEPVPIISMGFGQESWYSLSWSVPIAVFRVLIGILFLTFALAKAPWVDFGWYPDVVQNNIAFPSFGWYASFFEDVVQHNLAFFSWLQFLVEFLVGLGLLLGVLTLFNGVLGALWATQFAFGALAWPHEWEWAYILWIAGCLMVASCRAGRCFGADLRIAQWVENNEHSKLAKVLKYLA